VETSGRMSLVKPLTGHFGDDSFHTLYYTDTDNQA